MEHEIATGREIFVRKKKLDPGGKAATERGLATFLFPLGSFFFLGSGDRPCE